MENFKWEHQMTLEWQVMPTDIGAGKFAPLIFDGADDGNEEGCAVYLRMDENNKLTLLVYRKGSWSGFSQSNDNIVNVNKYNHVALTKSGKVFNVFLNGDKRSEMTVTATDFADYTGARPKIGYAGRSDQKGKFYLK
jgi:hypothetical protein